MSSATRTALRRLWRRPAHAASRHLWAVAAANTADGISARLAVDFTLEVVDPAGCPSDPDLVAIDVIDAVENALRLRILDSPVTELPTSGDSVAWLPADLVPGCRVTDAFVTASEVEVTPELRRLVAGSATV